MFDKLNQPKGSTIGVLKDGRTIQEAFDSMPQLKSFEGATPSDRLRAAITMGVSEILIGPVEENGGLPYEFGNVVIPYPLRIVGKGSQGINTTKGTVIKRSAGAPFMFHFSGEGQSQRPMGGGLFNINCNGDSATAIGDLIKVTQWSYFKAQNCAFQNMAGWAFRLKDVMESTITGNLFRRLGGPSGGGILLDDIRSAVTDNVNNLHIEDNTFALISGPWIGSTANSNPDLIWICRNKFEYDGTPAVPNENPSYVLDFAQLSRAFISENGFTHFTTARNNYAGVLRLGSTALGTVLFADNLLFACESAGVINGGIVESRGNINNQGSASAAITQFTNNSSKVCKLQRVVNIQSNGNVTVGNQLFPNGYINMAELPGNTRVPSVYDAEGETTSVLSVPAMTQVRQWTVPKMYQDAATVVKVTIRAKADPSGTTREMSLQSGSTVLRAWTVDVGVWKNYTYFIKANQLPTTLQVRNTGDGILLVDGMVFEKVTHVDWEFAVSPGTLAAGGKYTSPVQSHLDVAGVEIQSVSVPTFNSSSVGLQCWVETTNANGSFVVVLKNDTGAELVTTVTRCRIRAFIK